MKQKLIALLLVLCLLCSFPAAMASGATGDTLDKILTYYQGEGNELAHWWEVVALKSAGADLSKYQLPELQKEELEYGVSSIVGTIYTYAALEQSPRDAFDGIDLLELLASKQGADGSFGYVNEQIYAMMALEQFEQEYNRDLALSFLISNQMEDGAFAYNPAWGGDPDLTGMALSGLSYFQEIEEAKQAIEKAVAYLKEAQLETGGFETWGSVNSNTMESVISGLLDVGLDPTDAQWNGLVDLLISFQRENGAFAYIATDKTDNRMATYQALSTFSALKNGETMWKAVSYQPSEMELLYKDGAKIEYRYQKAVTLLTEKGIFSGYQGRFQPQEALTRAEFTKLLVALSGQTQIDTPNPFTDAAGMWYAPMVSTAYAKGWVNGVSETLFDGDSLVTREQAAAMLTRALELDGECYPEDFVKVSAYAKDAVSAVCAHEIFKLDDTGAFSPQIALSRQEAALVFANALNLVK